MVYCHMTMTKDNKFGTNLSKGFYGFCTSNHIMFYTFCFTVGLLLRIHQRNSALVVISHIRDTSLCLRKLNYVIII
jgi:hypothetical protein